MSYLDMNESQFSIFFSVNLELTLFQRFQRIVKSCKINHSTELFVPKIGRVRSSAPSSSSRYTNLI